MLNNLKKAVFPVAGLGSRFLPATKANPKEMLPIIDKPIIQYAVEEAIAAGFKEMIFITNGSKRAIEDHFDMNFELETRLEQQNKQVLLQKTKNILPPDIQCIYLRQAEPNGLGDAVLQAKSVIGNEPFAVILPDDLILTLEKNCLQQMVELFAQTQTNIIAVEEIDSKDIQKYGVVDPTKKINSSTYFIKGIVEKPIPEHAPSNLGVVGRYIFTPDIFASIENTKCGNGGEIQLTDAIADLLKKQETYAFKFEGNRYDCGDKLGYLKATIKSALAHKELSASFKKYLCSIYSEIASLL
ncbi:glucose-1-phosphate uridylyltransferase [Legionella wadsworthii]|uniref:UTP--glucose-1-phosphate uridylyltransferase n=1 Tax=Legionella wadsworthii TaxID=28088 RepID=A0A378LRN9_9GAMM|nr:UTP--glucose-1-phosphate uridylyltransferase GalU [Legionella wadsworthii]STY29040.1 glucose-1-phosphate uridylyltransferase [Legionella wadsworthii]